MGELVRIAPHHPAFRFIREDMMFYPYSDGLRAKGYSETELGIVADNLINDRLSDPTFGFYTLKVFPEAGYIGLSKKESTYPGKGKKLYRFAEVLGVYVNPRYRNHGYGKQLVASGLAWAKQRQKEVFVAWIHKDNQASLATFKASRLTLFNADEEGRCYAERWL